MYLSYAVLKELKNSRELPIYAFRARDCIQHFTSFIFIHFFERFSYNRMFI